MDKKNKKKEVLQAIIKDGTKGASVHIMDTMKQPGTDAKKDGVVKL